jgi:cullin 2
LDINWDIFIFQTAAWPINNANSFPVTLPSELENAVQKFEGYYHSRFNGRKLTWIHHLCHCKINLNEMDLYYNLIQFDRRAALQLLEENLLHHNEHIPNGNHAAVLSARQAELLGAQRKHANV